VPEPTCSVEGCPRPVKGRGLCNKHYKRWWRYGDVELRRVPHVNRKPCSIEGCIRLSEARGLCPVHYARWHDHGDPRHPGRQLLFPEPAPEARPDPDQAEWVRWLGA
jgi:hypothetical protein